MPRSGRARDIPRGAVSGIMVLSSFQWVSFRRLEVLDVFRPRSSRDRASAMPARVPNSTHLLRAMLASRCDVAEHHCLSPLVHLVRTRLAGHRHVLDRGLARSEVVDDLYVLQIGWQSAALDVPLEHVVLLGGLDSGQGPLACRPRISDMVLSS